MHLVQNYFTVPAGEAAMERFWSVCEAGSFFFLSPIVGAAFVWDAVARRRRPDAGAVLLSGAAVLLVLYACFGFPRVVARLLYLERMPGQRCLPAVGWIDFALVVSYFSAGLELSRRARWILAALWACALAAVGVAVTARTGGMTAWLVAPVVVAGALLGVGILRRRVAALAAFAAASIVVTSWFNPVVRAGSDFLTSNPFSQTVLELDRAAGGNSRWLVYGQPSLANLFRAIGVRAVNGVHFYPQRELWSRLGLGGRAAVWNRYAHVGFELPPSAEDARLGTRSGDTVDVALHPDHPVFARLGVDYVVWVGSDRGRLAGIHCLRHVASVGDKHVFRFVHDP